MCICFLYNCCCIYSLPPSHKHFASCLISTIIRTHHKILWKKKLQIPNFMKIHVQFSSSSKINKRSAGLRKRLTNAPCSYLHRTSRLSSQGRFVISRSRVQPSAERQVPWFSSPPSAKRRKEPQLWLWPLPSKSFTIHYSLIILLMDVI
jgi:hypothetical protein